MRPKYLEIEGLQSFINKQSVDFEELGETGLFGIFGPTGSGKSTVLDAITLALYGEVNRALSGTQGIINTGTATVRVLFEFDLKKENGYKSYRVERLYQRKKGTDNSCEAKIVRLVEIIETVEIPLADRAREVTAKVEELIGLRHDDFMRAVVLPQNKFQEFLMLDKSKKREMLERIFYLEEYGRQLTDKVAARMTTVRERLLIAQGELLALGDASNEALKAAEDSVNSSKERRSKALEGLKQAEAGFSEARELWRLVSDLDTVNVREKEHLTAAAGIEAKVLLLGKALKAKSLEDIITRFENVSKNLKEVLIKLQPMAEILFKLENELAAAKNLRDAGIISANEQKQLLVERRMRLNQASELKKEISRASTEIDAIRTVCVKLREDIQLSDKMIEEKQKLIELSKNNILEMKKQIVKLSVPIEYREKVKAAAKLEENLVTEENSLAAEKVHFDELAGIVGNLKARFAAETLKFENAKSSLALLAEKQAAHVLSMPVDREALNGNIEKYHKFKATATMLALKKSDSDAVTIKADSMKEAILKQKELLAGVTENRDKLYVKNSVLVNSTAEMRKALQLNAAFMLAMELKEGESCPVCGSSHHPELATIKSDSNIAGINNEIEASEKILSKLAVEIKEAEGRCTAVIEQIRQNDIQLEQMRKDIETRECECVALSEALSEELLEHFGRQADYCDALTDIKNLKPGIVEFEQTIENIGNKNFELLNAINEWEKIRELMKNQSLTANNELAGFNIAIIGIQAELKVNSENLVRLESIMNASAALYSKNNNCYKLLTKELDLVSALKESADILQRDTKIEELRKDSEKLQETVNDETLNLDIAKEERRKKAEDFATIVNDGKHLKEQKDGKEARLLELAGDCDIEKEISLIDTDLIEIGRNEKKAAELVESLDVKVKDISMQKNTLEGQRNTFTASSAEIERSLSLQLAERGFTDIEEAKRNIISSVQIKAFEGEIAAYRQTESNLRAQKEILLKKLDGHSITEQEWNMLQKDYDVKLMEKDESASAFEVARSIFLTLKQRNGRWISLSGELKDIEHKTDMLEHIKSLLKGNSFIEYVAEERLRYIAREASETLGVMTRYRYALELDSDNGFVIRDNSNGGVHRPVTTLSGGEVFLTSLSLALALSNQIHLKGQSPLEFFFLDEGFGTLDDNLLDQVIDSLERISTKERMIGLISHVPELKNRITRRLIVDPPDQDGNGSIVRVEKA